MHFVVKMRSGRAAGVARFCDHLIHVDRFVRLYAYGGKVPVKRCQSVAVGKDDTVSVTAFLSRKNYRTFCGRTHIAAVGYGVIHPFMELDLLLF